MRTINKNQVDGCRKFISLVEVEQDESLEGGGWVLFDSVIEEAFNNIRRGFDFSPDHLEFEDIHLTLRASLSDVAKRSQEMGLLDGQWVRITVDIRVIEDGIPAEVVLFGDNPDGFYKVSISAFEVVPTSSARQIDYLAMLRDEPRSTVGFIAGVLDAPLRQTSLESLSVSVYDVGQGNCNALVDWNEHPLVYFDLGWAPNFHSKSRPDNQPNFFSCDSAIMAPVVLSHWDMDHWCYAIKNSTFNPSSLTTRHEWKPEALRRFWISRAPRIKEHKLGPLTIAFYKALKATHLLPGMSSILLWPESSRRIRFSAGWLEACHHDGTTDVPNDRNNNGLAMFVRPDPKNPAILLTGDADFPCIPSLSRMRKTPLAGVVAPHHGARISGRNVPKPQKGSLARLVMSVGNQNSYGHPKAETIKIYSEHGWVSSGTKDRYECDCGSVTHYHGNTVLTSRRGLDPQCGCNCVPSGHMCLHSSTKPLTAPTPGEKPKKKKVAVAA